MRYGAGPNGVMRSLGQYMLMSGTTFGYGICLSSLRSGANFPTKQILHVHWKHYSNRQRQPASSRVLRKGKKASGRHVPSAISPTMAKQISIEVWNYGRRDDSIGTASYYSAITTSSEHLGSLYACSGFLLFPSQHPPGLGQVAVVYQYIKSYRQCTNKPQLAPPCPAIYVRYQNWIFSIMFFHSFVRP